jgi:hypothetical protein
MLIKSCSRELIARFAYFSAGPVLATGHGKGLISPYQATQLFASRGANITVISARVWQALHSGGLRKFGKSQTAFQQ